MRLRTLIATVFLLSLQATYADREAHSSDPLVGHIMALLSVFEQAGALPPETSPEAQTLIHALIQTQAALRKTTHEATRLWFSEALMKEEQTQGQALPRGALTSRTMEAIVSYAAVHPPTYSPEVMAGLTEFNVGRAELEIMAKVYWRAKSALAAMGHDLHAVYDHERGLMPPIR